MIRITVELISARGAPRAIIGRAIICNDGTGTPTRGNYTGTLWRKRRSHWKIGRTHGFARQRLSVWHLLRDILNDALKNAS